MTFNNTELTEETLLKTDKHFADIYQGCIDEAVSGEVYVNDLEVYIGWNSKIRDRHLEGLGRNTLTYLQYAYYIQTGESVALLPK